MLSNTHLKVQRKQTSNTTTRKKPVNSITQGLTKAKTASKPLTKDKASKPSVVSAAKLKASKPLHTNHTNIQSTLCSLNQFTPKNQKLQFIKSSTNSNADNLNKQRISTASSIEKMKNGGDYATIFGLLNSEIREITDLFKRTQSVDQQGKKDELLLKKAKGFFHVNEDVDYVLFEKCLCEEEDKEEKVLDISNLEGSDAKKMNNCDSVLFSSYNSELYRNLNKDESCEVISEPLSISSHNVVKIAKANVFKNKHSRQKSSSIYVENGSDKTECQFTDVVFNHNSSSSSSLSEKTCDMMQEKEHEVHYVPIQEVMKQIRNYKSQPVCIRKPQ